MTPPPAWSSRGRLPLHSCPHPASPPRPPCSTTWAHLAPTPPPGFGPVRHTPTGQGPGSAPTAARSDPPPHPSPPPCRTTLATPSPPPTPPRIRCSTRLASTQPGTSLPQQLAPRSRRSTSSSPGLHRLCRCIPCSRPRGSRSRSGTRRRSAPLASRCL